MIVLNDQPGQLANRLWSIAPFAAFCMAGSQSLLVPFFGDYAALFPALNRFTGILFVRSHGRLYLRIMRRLLRLLRGLPQPIRQAVRLWIDDANWGAEAWSPDVLRARWSCVFLSGWNQPPPLADLSPFRSQLRELFAPHQEFRIKGEALISRLRKEHDHVIGVHVRRGDYRTWLDGRYFYPLESYAGAMRSLEAQLTGRCAFLICSNEVESTLAFDDLQTYRLPEADGIEDMFALSLCDFVVGPPSTFSMWASFYGAVPLRFIEQAGQPVLLQDFSRIVALNSFENGKVFSLDPTDTQKLGLLNTAFG